MGEAVKRVLILSYYFPPDGGPGTQRALKFSKYLPDFGWSPIVVTRTEERERNRWEPEDKSLEGEIGEETTVIRVAPAPGEIPPWVEECPTIGPARDWIGPACEAAERIIREAQPAAVLITMSPFDLSFIGQRIAQATDVPVVVDLRDPWALDGWRVQSNRSGWSADFRIMSDTLTGASAVIANTPEARRAFLSEIGGLEPDRVGVIPNGFDAEDFGALDGARPARNPARFRLVHTGTLHCAHMLRLRGLSGFLRRLKQFRPEPIDPTGRTIEPLMRAVALLDRDHHPLVEKLDIVLTGTVDDATKRLVDKAGLARTVHYAGYLSHQDSVASLIAADALFLPLHALPPGHRSRIVPGKTYEYLAAGKPILGCLPDGDARDLVERSGLGYLADPIDPHSIQDALIRLYRDWDGGGLDDARPAEWVNDYERRALTQNLADLLDHVIARRHPMDAAVSSVP